MWEAFDGLFERYRKLAQSGQIELSMTPYGHPIVPLLIDLDSMHGACPSAGAQRTNILAASNAHAGICVRAFGYRTLPRLPPAGRVAVGGWCQQRRTEATGRIRHGLSASGEGVWHNSRFLSGLEITANRRGAACSVLTRCRDARRMFFRDDGLSDMIGFEYQQRNAGDAAADFGQHQEYRQLPG